MPRSQLTSRKFPTFVKFPTQTQTKNMTKELENLISLLESPIKENKDFGIILAQNYNKELKEYFGYEIELFLFLRMNLEWNSEIPIHKIEKIKIEKSILASVPTHIFLLESLTWLSFVSASFSIFPTEILQLSQLRTLCFSNSQIKVLPAKIRKLQALEILNIDVNRLQRLPKEIGDLKNLYILTLGHNQLKSLPKEIGDLRELIHLKLNNNQLKKLPKEIGNLRKLIQLELNANQLKS